MKAAKKLGKKTSLTHERDDAGGARPQAGMWLAADRGRIERRMRGEKLGV